MGPHETTHSPRPYPGRAADRPLRLGIDPYPRQGSSTGPEALRVVAVDRWPEARSGTRSGPSWVKGAKFARLYKTRRLRECRARCVAMADPPQPFDAAARRPARPARNPREHVLRS